MCSLDLQIHSKRNGQTQQTAQKYLSSRSPSLWQEYRIQRNEVVSLQRKAKREYFHRLISNNASPNTLWNTLRSACPSSKSFSSTNWNLLGPDHTTVANRLNQHFVSVSSSSPVLSPPSCLYSPSSILTLSPTTPEWCEGALSSLKSSSGPDQIPSCALKAAKSIINYPLSSILNTSISTSTFPISWKCSSVKPLHKGGDRSNLSNFRPISILPACSKLLEKCVQNQLFQHLSSNNLLFSHQAGFRPGHSTQSLLLYCTDKWYKSLDRREYIAVLFLDVSKAFDTVNHSLLLSKLHLLGLDPSAVLWFKSYLSDRSQVTCIDGSSSSPGFLSSGVPQGSVLGPALFSIFINDLPQMLPPDSTLLFADDTTIFLSGTDPQALNSSLQSRLDLANSWMEKNGLKLNASKTKCMLIHSPRKKHCPSLNIHLSGQSIEQVRSFKFLGVLINDTLSWDDHINNIVSKVSRKLNLLRRLSWFLPRSLLILFLKSYVFPIFDYCDVVWNSCSKKDSDRLQSLLNYGCTIVLQKPRYSSASQIRNELGLSTLESRRKLHLLQVMYNCLSSRAPSYLSTLFRLPSHDHYTRSSCLINLPSVKSSFGQRAFSFSGVSLWHSIPTSVRMAESSSIFSRLVFDILNN